MPELPEVENFRQLLLPLVGDQLHVQVIGDHHRIKVDEIISGAKNKKNRTVVCSDVLRRGKQICIVLSLAKSMKKYLFLHMGMSGRIRVYGKSENWGDIKKDDINDTTNDIVGHTELPIMEDETSIPKYTYLIFSSPESNYTAYFCDPRKFGSAYLSDDLSDLDALAPDALTCMDNEIVHDHIVPSLTNQRLGIKAILLDQKRAVSGVGNWVADEVLYQCKFHPDQTMLDSTEADTIQKKLYEIVSIAVKCLENDESYPAHWLFHYRWTGKKAGKDAEGRPITFLTSGGRTTAIIASMQKLYARKSLLKSPARTKKDAINVEKSPSISNNTRNETSDAIEKSSKKTSLNPKEVAIAAHATDNGETMKVLFSPTDENIKKKRKTRDAAMKVSSTSKSKRTKHQSTTIDTTSNRDFLKEKADTNSRKVISTRRTSPRLRIVQ